MYSQIPLLYILSEFMMHKLMGFCLIEFHFYMTRCVFDTWKRIEIGLKAIVFVPVLYKQVIMVPLRTFSCNAFIIVQIVVCSQSQKTNSIGSLIRKADDYLHNIHMDVLKANQNYSLNRIVSLYNGWNGLYQM